MGKSRGRLRGFACLLTTKGEGFDQWILPSVRLVVQNEPRQRGHACLELVLRSFFCRQAMLQA